MSNTDTTNVVGYYNGNKWPIQLVISHFNITLHLQPGEFILDKQGRKINDPFFEKYAASKQLSRETSTTPVALVRVPLASNPAGRVVPDGQSVRAVTQFTSDVRGQKVPIIPQPKSVPEHAPNQSSVIPMTMEEARKAGLVQKTREVPEDYGAPETDSGAPPRKMPTIKYATDLKPTKAAPLPPQVTESMPQGRQVLVAQLAKAVAAPVEPESASAFLNTVTPTAPPNAPVTSGVPADAPLPPPEIEEGLEVPEPPAEDDGPSPDDEPVTKKVAASSDKYVCVACGKGFPFRSQLERHARQVHRSDLEAVMAPYPEAR